MAELISAALTNPDPAPPSYDAMADAFILEDKVQRESRAVLISGSAWGEFLRKVLAPDVSQPTMRLLRSHQA
jgi:hypothetical protein